MPSFHLHSTKYDGSLHYRYAVEPLHRSETELITLCMPGTPVQSYRGQWTTSKTILSFFWKSRPWVLHVRWQNDWEPEFLYVDITTATSWDEQTVRYIDLDLDVILRHQTAEVELDDQDEFETHARQWNYPSALVKTCWSAVEDVRRMLQTQTHPFTPALFAWRPGKPLP
jgi:protein associated with RNAse G/E